MSARPGVHQCGDVLPNALASNNKVNVTKSKGNNMVFVMDC